MGAKTTTATKASQSGTNDINALPTTTRSNPVRPPGTGHHEDPWANEVANMAADRRRRDMQDASTKK